MIHRRTHPTFVAGCFACKLATVDFGAAATPYRRPAANNKVAMEARWNADIPAYRRLLKDGLEPRQIDGCAAIEARAETAHDVNPGRYAPSE